MLDPHKKTIIFDFGNVLFDLDFDRCIDTFEEVLGVRWEARHLPADVISAIKKYDRGHISDEAFLWVLQQYNTNANPRDLIRAWNSLLVGMPEHRLDMLTHLRKDYNLAKLSNINNLHLRYIHRYLEKNYGIGDYEERFFDQVFYSHLIHKRKPDDEVYAHVSDVLRVNVQDIVFIDDLKENVEAAISHGWHAIQHNPKKDIAQMLPQYLEQMGF